MVSSGLEPAGSSTVGVLVSSMSGTAL
jgi:hypothetical protein